MNRFSMFFVLRTSLFVLCLLHCSPVVAQHTALNLPDGALASFGRMPFHNGSRIHASELSTGRRCIAPSGV